MSERSMEDDLADWGKVIRLHTTGSRSGRTRTVTIGFVEEADGSLLVAAGSDGAGWAVNLRSTPACEVERDGRRIRCRAEPLAGTARALAISGLVLKYGTPAERLGAGPAFRLTPEC
ncbi:MAG: nitroreductase/quinone reductase family protein [Candidatus Limnocylindrales bacterium]